MVGVVHVEIPIFGVRYDTQIPAALIGAAFYILCQRTCDDRPELAKRCSIVFGHRQGDAAVETGNPAWNRLHSFVILGMVERQQFAGARITGSRCQRRAIAVPCNGLVETVHAQLNLLHVTRHVETYLDAGRRLPNLGRGQSRLSQSVPNWAAPLRAE